MAHKHPEKNFLGIDRMRARVRKVSSKLMRAELCHVRLLRIEASYALHHLLPPDSVSTYTIFFPDPWPKRRHHRRRLFCPAFMDDLARTLRPGGQLHVATDHREYFDAIVKLFESDARFRPVAPFEPAPDELTDFELVFRQRGKPVGRASFERV